MNNIPHKIEAQLKFFHAIKQKVEKRCVKVNEWYKESKDFKLPNKVKGHKFKI